MNKELIVIGNFRPEKGIADKSRVFDVGGGVSNDISNSL